MYLFTFYFTLPPSLPLHVPVSTSSRRDDAQEERRLLSTSSSGSRRDDDELEEEEDQEVVSLKELLKVEREQKVRRGRK